MVSESTADLLANPPKVRHGWRWWVITTIATLAIAGSGVALTVSFSTQAARNAEVACQAKINADFQNRIVARNDPNVRDREAQDSLASADAKFDQEILAALDLTRTDPAAGVAALREATIRKQAAHAAYEQQRAVDDAARAQQPLVATSPATCS